LRRDEERTGKQWTRKTRKRKYWRGKELHLRGRKEYVWRGGSFETLLELTS